MADEGIVMAFLLVMMSLLVGRLDDRSCCNGRAPNPFLGGLPEVVARSTMLTAIPSVKCRAICPFGSHVAVLPICF